MTLNGTIDKIRKYVEINNRAITSKEVQEIYDSIDDIDGWTIRFNFSKQNKKYF